MSLDLAELSSIETSLEQLMRRVAAMADQAIAERQERLAADLVAIERSINGAHRRLARMRRP